MNTDPEDFEALRKLLAIKKHEQPPPGYFNDLPSQIWRKIESEPQPQSFWEKIFPAISIKPSVAYAFGLVVCGTLIIGIGSSLKTTPERQAGTPVLQAEGGPVIPVTSAAASLDPNSRSSTNPVTGPQLFPKPQLQAQPVGFQE